MRGRKREPPMPKGCIIGVLWAGWRRWVWKEEETGSPAGPRRPIVFLFSLRHSEPAVLIALQNNLGIRHIMEFLLRFILQHKFTGHCIRHTLLVANKVSVINQWEAVPFLSVSFSSISLLYHRRWSIFKMSTQCRKWNRSQNIFHLDLNPGVMEVWSCFQHPFVGRPEEKVIMLGCFFLLHAPPPLTFTLFLTCAFLKPMQK